MGRDLNGMMLDFWSSISARVFDIYSTVRPLVTLVTSCVMPIAPN